MNEFLKLPVEAPSNTANRLPQSQELASEEVRREVEARKVRDAREQKAADDLRKILFGPKE